MGADRMRAPEANARRSLDALEARRGGRPSTAPRLPAERDGSSSMTGGEPDIEIGGQRLYGMPLGEHAPAATGDLLARSHADRDRSLAARATGTIRRCHAEPVPRPRG